MTYKPNEFKNLIEFTRKYAKNQQSTHHNFLDKTLQEPLISLA